MHKRIKRIWLEALRGGKYEQTTGVLRSKKDGFCCLGVLCDLYIKAHPKELCSITATTAPRSVWNTILVAAHLAKLAITMSGTVGTPGHSLLLRRGPRIFV